MTAALLLGSNAPDIDIVTTVSGAATYLEWHRGPTHGPVGIVALGVAIAAIVVGLGRVHRNSDSKHASFGALARAAMIGVLCHVLMDLPTSYGTRLLSPFSWTWFAEDWFPIVDVYLLAILSVTLWFGRSAPARNAAIAMALMLGYYGFRGILHGQALASAPGAFGAQLPGRCENGDKPRTGIDRWPLATAASPRDSAGRRCVVAIAALPDFLSPFQWRLIAQLTNSYEVRTINLLDRFNPRGMSAPDTRLFAVRYPNQWTPAVVKASAAPVARTFLGFSRFPSVRSFVDEAGNATVVWTDLRFLAADGAPDSRRPAPSLFGASVRVGPGGAILSERLGSQ